MYVDCHFVADNAADEVFGGSLTDGYFFPNAVVAKEGVSGIDSENHEGVAAHFVDREAE